MIRLGRRERRALALAPLTAPLGYFAAIALGAAARWAATGDGGMSLTGAARVLGLVLVIGAPIAYATMLVGGLPAYLFLRRGGHAGPALLWATGAVLGAAVAALLQPGLRGDLFSIPFPMWGGAVLGVATAEVFRRLQRPRLAPPDERDATRAEPRRGAVGERLQP